MAELENEDVMSIEDVQRFTLVTLMQIKDYMAVMAFEVNPMAAEKVQAAHADGGLVLDPPFYTEE